MLYIAQELLMTCWVLSLCESYRWNCRNWGEWIANNSDLQSVIGLVWSLGDTMVIKETNRLKFKFAFILSGVRYPPKIILTTGNGEYVGALGSLSTRFPNLLPVVLAFLAPHVALASPRPFRPIYQIPHSTGDNYWKPQKI